MAPNPVVVSKDSPVGIVLIWIPITTSNLHMDPKSAPIYIWALNNIIWYYSLQLLDDIFILIPWFFLCFAYDFLRSFLRESPLDDLGTK